MHLSFSKTLAKFGKMRLGFGLRVTKKNYWWMCFLFMFVCIAQLFWYMMIVMFWLVYAVCYLIYLCIKKLLSCIFKKTKAIAENKKEEGLK